MLVELAIRDIVLIEKLDIRFDTGLSILSGETGAGKSILLDALSLALGSRGDASLVRSDAPQGEVRAVFDIAMDHPVREHIRQNGLDDEGDIILRRIQAKDGRSRGFINDQSVSLTLMRDVAKLLVEIHGQHADRALIAIDSHRHILDEYAGLVSSCDEVKRLYRHWQSCERALASQRDDVERARREVEFLTASLEELEQLNPQSGEEEDLAVKRTHMMQAEKIAGDINEAYEILLGAQAPTPILANLVRRLERKSAEMPQLIDPIIKAFDDAMVAIGVAQDGIEQVIEEINFDRHDLEAVEERLFALRAAARKYNVHADQLAEIAQKMADDLKKLEDDAIRLDHLEEEVVAAKHAYSEAASELSSARKASALTLEAAVMAELGPLKLGQAQFFVEIVSDENTPHSEGIDRVEFLVKTNPGSQAGPLLKVASGGELSRFLLALKVVMADRGSAPTLVFDEIDTGVGGAVADAIGQRLKRLARNVQVLAVTHAPQVAARADHHFLIAKVGNSERLLTTIDILRAEQREEEIARMLSGSEITLQARAAAQRLLADS